jgi:tetratricopeptide (TPR) repeat protein
MDPNPDQPPVPSPSPGSAADSSARIRRRVRTKGKRIPRVVRTNYFLHILFYDGRFRWALIATLLVFFALGLLVPRIWITSPDDYSPQIKVRGLDLLQSWALRRSAEREAAAGRIPSAIQAWVSASANNAADPQNLRGLLRALASQPLPDRAWLGAGQQSAANLLRLAHTNLADLELAVRFHQRYDQHDWVSARLSDPGMPTSPALTAAQLWAHFQSGQMQKFDALWRQRGETVAGRPESALYHAAWQAGWGPTGESNAGKASLEEALKDPALRPLALSLLLRVHNKNLDLASYERRLAELADLHADTLKDNLTHWLLLDLSGQHERAVMLARAETTLPQSAGEAEQLLAAWMRLGLYDEGVDFIRKQMPAFAQSPAIWVRAGHLLITGKRWDDLRILALELRSNFRLKAVLGSYSLFLEGVANHGLGRQQEAEENFNEFAKELPRDPAVTFQAAVQLTRLGYPGPAAVVLHQLEKVAGNDLTFWRQLQLTAFEGRQAEQLLAASEKVHQLHPDDASATNLAAALMMMRERPSEAVQLTLQVYTHAPQSRMARVNHALALVQNGRVEEGEQLLKTVSPQDLTDSARSMLQFVWFQCHLRAGRTAEARAAAELIDVRHLFPPQVQWLQQARAELPAG